MNNLSIGKRLMLLMLVNAALLLAVAGIGWKIGGDAVAALETVYADRTMPMKDLAKIGELLGNNTREILLALQHDPTGPMAAAHDHPVGMHLENFKKRRAEIGVLWDKYMATYLTEEEKLLAADFATKRKAWVETAAGMLDRIKGGDYSFATLSAVLVATRTEGLAAQTALDSLMDYQIRNAKETFEAQQQAHRTGILLFVVIVFGGLAGVGMFTLYLARAISGPINTSVAIAEAIANGDLTRPVPAGGKDEAGRLLAAFARMQEGLRNMVGASQKSAQELSRAAQDLTGAARQSATATAAQSEAASGMAAAVEELSVSFDQVRDHAQEAKNVATGAGEASRDGGQVVHAAAEEMRQVAAAVNEAAGTIRELETYSNEISSVINVIREVADQTNLLALNAAIEAARAGEQGRGFAVVADEVRKLAERTSESTRTIATVIDKVQAGARRAAQEMESGVARVDGGVKLAQQAGESIIGIQSSTQHVRTAVDDIGSALDEQAGAAQEIARGVEKIATMSEENSASVRQTTAAAEQLQKLAAELDQSVARFRV
ncbi:MAG: methyl-accepting chemotaxis protein [Gammaproteobacteria bacterium]|nr:methyl-accepting chemotaxis protein [Rhodocyclaceae bacterium]MBU3909425.1 methyl-accepting chemotaxis protein [Gammaproteobacteria bacterium]MBU3988585.1 methyl-accepting chemotaxis protein [Gammaproteobacteria bacterium]MBU4005345.1 methyl-accepting chemotaxis protein [Gammaproteobacteria bacterium]MBU4021961.1 methyl-accepting chemotaxis protein [Gammaproteobacteria bacterium]